jgi:hypothetical protein
MSELDTLRSKQRRQERLSRQVIVPGLLVSCACSIWLAWRIGTARADDWDLLLGWLVGVTLLTAIAWLTIFLEQRFTETKIDPARFSWRIWLRWWCSLLLWILSPLVLIVCARTWVPAPWGAYLGMLLLSALCIMFLLRGWMAGAR